MKETRDTTTTDTTTAMTPAPPGRTPWHKRRWIRVTAGLIAVPTLIGIGASLGSAGSHPAAAPAKPAVTAPAHKATPKPAAPAPASTALAAQPSASAPAASSAPAAPASQVLMSTSGTGSYNSQPFQVTGNAPS